MVSHQFAHPSSGPDHVVVGLARDILDAFTTGKRFAQSAAPPTARAAYEVQAAVAARRGPVAGFKTARKPGQPNIMAPIMASDVVPGGARVSSRFGGALGVELELGFHILSPLPSHEDPGFLAALHACVEPLALIELVDTRLDGPAAADPMAKLADAQMNAGLVLGPPLASWDGGALACADASMRAGETVLLAGRADVPGGDARETLRALAGMIGDHCGGLQPGQIVITGSLHPLAYVAPDSVVEGWIDGFGDVSVEIR
jgi:2-keto-4-pentenoate hydratase